MATTAAMTDIGVQSNSGLQVKTSQDDKSHLQPSPTDPARGSGVIGAQAKAQDEDTSIDNTLRSWVDDALSFAPSLTSRQIVYLK